MICPSCAKAADERLPRDAHCDDPGCTCGHRPPKDDTTRSSA